MGLLHRRLLLAGAAFGAVSVLTACAGGADGGPLPPRAASGLDYAQAVCGQCHAVKAGEPSPNPLAPRFTDIARDYSDYGFDMELDAIASIGHFAMPPMLIPPAERKALTAYVRLLKARQAEPVD